MSSFKKEIAQSKISELKNYLIELEKVAELTFDDYLADVFRKKGIEKTLIDIIQTAIDLNTYILTRKFNTTPVDYFDTFIKMAQQEVFPFEFAKEIAPSASLRNRLLHEYGKINDHLVYSSIKKTLEEFPRYIAYITEFLEKTC